MLSSYCFVGSTIFDLLFVLSYYSYTFKLKKTSHSSHLPSADHQRYCAACIERTLNNYLSDTH